MELTKETNDHIGLTIVNELRRAITLCERLAERQNALEARFDRLDRDAAITLGNLTSAANAARDAINNNEKVRSAQIEKLTASALAHAEMFIKLAGDIEILAARIGLVPPAGRVLN